jgi:hypothetical protein
MLGAAAPDAPADVAELREEGGWFIVSLRRSSGEALGEKRLPATLSCEVRAEAAAVSLAALEGQLAGDSDLPLPAPAPEAPPPPLVAATPAVAVVKAAPPRPEVRAPIVPEVGAAVLASLTSAGAAPSARVELALARAGSPWTVMVAGLGVGTHRTALGPGSGSWRRLGGELSLRGRVPLGGGVRVEPGAGVALTALSVTGEGFSRNSGAVLFDPGGVARLRLVPTVWIFRIWLEGAVAYWPRSHGLTIDGVGGAQAGRVPTLEAFIGAGASFGGNP